MKVMEYQAKEMLRRAGFPTPTGKTVTTPAEARAVAAELGTPVVIKAQVPIGGRGKAGGISLASGPEEAEKQARRILAMQVRGYSVNRLLVEEAADVASEFYLSIALDRQRRMSVLIVSAAGGMEIEEVAAATPQKIGEIWLHPAVGLREYHLRAAAEVARIPATVYTEFQQLVRVMYELYQKHDAILIEINPLVLTKSGFLLPLDAKIEIDENAMYRQKALACAESDEGAHPLELKARSKGLSYVKLQGEVGVIGNGAGLVMATLDMIQKSGGRPANFLDIGGGAQSAVVENALDIVLSDKSVRSVLINVFGGITRCDEVARGCRTVLEKMRIKVPVVLRLAGTKAVEGRALLVETAWIVADTLAEAAAKAVALAKQEGGSV